MKKLPSTIIKLSQKTREKAIFAREPVQKGQIIFSHQGDLPISPRPDKYTIQLDYDKHYLGNDYEWRFLNHSCEANSIVREEVDGFSIVAHEDIAEGEEIFINYVLSEYRMDQPFDCQCQSITCRDVIQGYDFLVEEEKEKIADLVLPYLKRTPPNGSTED